MRPELEEIKVLNDFLHDRLAEPEHIHISIRLLWDQDLQKRTAAQQLAYQALQAAGRQQLRAELRTIHARLFG